MGIVCSKKRHAWGGKPPEIQKRTALPTSVPIQVEYLTCLEVVYVVRNCSSIPSLTYFNRLKRLLPRAIKSRRLPPSAAWREGKIRGTPETPPRGGCPLEP